MSPPSQAHPSSSKPSSVSIRFSKDWENYLEGPERFLQNHSLKQMLFVAYVVRETQVGKAQVKNKESSHPKEIIVTFVYLLDFNSLSMTCGHMSIRSLIDGSGDSPISVWVAPGGERLSGATGSSTRTYIHIANDSTDFFHKLSAFWERTIQEPIIPDLCNSIRVETSSKEVITFSELAKRSELSDMIGN